MTVQVLVTGAGGLIGGRVTELLRAHGGDPVALVRTAGAARVGVETITADLSDPGFVSRLPSRMDAVVHLAQSPGYAGFPEGAQSVFQVNVGAFACLLYWAAKAGVRHFVHASTAGVYGRGPRPFREEDPVRLQGPLGFYFSTKAGAELLATAYGGIFSVTALRFSFVYGPGQKDTMLIPRLVQSVADGKPVTLAGENGMRINPVYVDDAAAAVLAALRRDESTVVNVAGAEILSIRDIAEIAGETLGKRPLFERSNEPDGNDLVVDITRMRVLLHSPSVSFHDGLARLVQVAYAGKSR